MEETANFADMMKLDVQECSRIGLAVFSKSIHQTNNDDQIRGCCGSGGYTIYPLGAYHNNFNKGKKASDVLKKDIAWKLDSYKKDKFDYCTVSFHQKRKNKQTYIRLIL